MTSLRTIQYHSHTKSYLYQYMGVLRYESYSYLHYCPHLFTPGIIGSLSRPHLESQGHWGRGGSPVQRPQSPGLRTVAALLSPFLVPRLQLLGSIPQEDVVLFLGVVVLMALRQKYKNNIRYTKYEQRPGYYREMQTTAHDLLPLTSHNWKHMQRCCHCGWNSKPWWADQAALRSSTWCGHLCPRSWSARLSPQ